ncbi:hypothetical protein CJD36_011810 [Flavipsychrobacter stenotrophus]|uniref:Uncharacterized protein n=1 Tax=Flavipsychrobacter stenotrophus TaxID=2077091 RepID=A0A2S7SUP7_9BACT|nr:hypothetical protein [Flavipsychrobacter stenotrophus]PQJ10652.1 hypothetical protein CJD36_011810 [Flavipsychrobacter stenotrophus]
MKNPKNNIVLLTSEEKEWLLEIYHARKDNLFFAGALRSLVLCVLWFTIGMWFAAFIHEIFFYKLNGSWFTHEHFWGKWWLKTIVILLMEVAVCLFTWFGVILPFKQDALSGIKEQVSFNIAIKEHYPITGQYFFRFRHKIDQLHEVDEARYNQYDEAVTYL